MASSNCFRVIKHEIHGQHVREYANGTRGQHDAVIRLAVNQYIPRRQAVNEDRTVTLLSAHGNGFPKECYEPLFERLVDECHQREIEIRNIWIADTSNQGGSGVLNESAQGDEPSWLDHARDLLLTTNAFRDDFKRPVIGLGHSMGCGQLINLALLHPRLLSGLILLEPSTIARSGAPQIHPSGIILRRPDVWPSREAAAKTLRKHSYFKEWDAAVFERYIAYGLRQLPTQLHTSEPQNEGAVTLTTTKHQEAWGMGLLNLEPVGRDPVVDRILSPDVPEDQAPFISSAPAMFKTFDMLPSIRPDTHWIFAQQSPYNRPVHIAVKLKLTGTGPGGNGGVKAGSVTGLVLHGVGHFLPFDHVHLSARECAGKIALALESYGRREAVLKQYPSRKSDEMMLRTSEEALEALRLPFKSKRSSL